MKVFLSYSSEDRMVAKEICYAIRDYDHTVFIDKEALPVGSGYHSRIKQEIEQSDVFVFLISPHSIKKGCYALTELEFAKQKWPSASGRVLPVIVKPTDISMIDRYLTSVTFCEPAGNIAAEVAANLERLLADVNAVPVSSIKDLSFDNLSKASKTESSEILSRYKRRINTNPMDGLAHYGLALWYLHARLYDLAIKHFGHAVELLPDYPDAHYYYGLSLIRGRRPMTLSLKEVRRIEECLQAAIQLDDQPAKYYYLAAILKDDFYRANGLVCDPPSAEELISTAGRKYYDRWEVERLLAGITLRDKTLISRIRRG